MNILTHLHQARLNCQLELSELAARTAISPSVLAKIDEGRFAELPAGIYARSYVRSFAAEVGVDP
ncbi:MAG: helix-turn-helix domain-containing protein, partial [Acidobacteria bacterium]|nr:helix-turn-helix domain-containing protein [Acidobacteriota bacterium]